MCNAHINGAKAQDQPVAPKGATFVWLVLLLIGIAVAGCGRNQDSIKTVTGLAMGTSYSVKWVVPELYTGVTHEQISDGIQMVIAGVEASMSQYISDSDISRINSAPVGAWVSLPDPLFGLIQKAQEVSIASAGAFDITVGEAVNVWGFGPQGRPESIPTDIRLEALSATIGYQHIQLQNEPPALNKTQDLHLDLSAIAKGYGVDQVANWLESIGVSHYLVEIGGELRAKGTKSKGQPWRIAIESPEMDARSVFKVLRIENQAVATSGNYRNYFEEDGVRYSHTLDPKTLRPVSHKLASVTVIADNAAKADALATTLMVMGEERGSEWAREHGVMALFIWRQNDTFVSAYVSGFDRYLENQAKP